LGSTSITTDASGNKMSELRYKPWGEVRQPANGHNPGPSDYTRRVELVETFTGQYSHVDDFGLYFFNARWYDPALGRFAQADSIIPQGQGVQAWDRYAFVNNNPVRYTDPSGHWIETALDIAFIAYDIYDISSNGLNWVNGLSLAADVACTVLPIATGGGILVRAAAHADDAVKVISHADDVLHAAKTLDGIADAAKTLEKVDIIKDLASGTSQSKRIAEAMRNGDIGVNILGDELFENAYRYFGGKGNPKNVAAFARAEQTYLRKTSTNIFRDAVHEGTHALDYLQGIVATEKRAYYFERSFQIFKNRLSEFDDLRDILRHIERWY
jgi:RHS repeat-associated protein